MPIRRCTLQTLTALCTKTKFKLPNCLPRNTVFVPQKPAFRLKCKIREMFLTAYSITRFKSRSLMAWRLS